MPLKNWRILRIKCVIMLNKWTEVRVISIRYAILGMYAAIVTIRWRLVRVNVFVKKLKKLNQ